ncbi:MAG: hypothetical protein IT493_02110 [Gammaproteobacteria bacterium]|nr:hypothetical protein [Gammaproteobacteria bacterium]
MNRTYLLWIGSLVAALSTGTGAMAGEATGSHDKGYCTIPYLYATNIRPACEQLGSIGVKALYSENRMFDQMLNRPHIADVFPDPDLHRRRS